MRSYFWLSSTCIARSVGLAYTDIICAVDREDREYFVGGGKWDVESHNCICELLTAIMSAEKEPHIVSRTRSGGFLDLNCPVHTHILQNDMEC